MIKHKLKSTYNANLSLSAVSTPLYDTVDAANTFYAYNNESIEATCKYTFTVNSKTLNIYVADNCFETGDYPVTQTLVNYLAEQFLSDGTNDIYGWITDIYGAEWGTHSYTSELIDSSNTGNITILIYNIYEPLPGMAGFFWAKDNLSKDYYAYSNGRLMFYIDSYYLSHNNGADKDKIVSTLAHEFQHMIHFYQKAVSRSGFINSDTWIDEMCSLTAEDLVADKLGLSASDSVRGIIGTTYTAGSSGITYGRLPRFNNPAYYDSLTDWNSSLKDYSSAYAFGAYIARNYGGATLMGNIVQNPYTDYQAVTTTTAANVSFSSLLK